ncbi:hypothetical protein FNV43_RR06817 [Rhamnella rubrinervis]|uniref:Acyl-coenzyme A thioesterase 13 n=1 Tax=Rhamnella rubrinervis TaxID=2594499 RepID=A0A8K0MM51_9ROSA|nr:hypothetical protein FNV43_RR06817 [Rhamnella rubrinervis]
MYSRKSCAAKSTIKDAYFTTFRGKKSNMENDDDDSYVLELVRSIQDLSTGRVEASELVRRSLRGLEVVHAQKGLLRYKFVIPNDVSDDDGNWHVGAIASLIDVLGVSAAYTSTGLSRLTVDFNISYYSTAKTQEEVEIVAKVVSERAMLTSVLLEVRKTNNGQLVALGRQWVASNQKIRQGDPVISKL